MQIEEVSKKIYDIALPIAEKCEAPIAYITILKGKDSQFSDIELYKAFNKMKWNTKLSTSELSFTKTDVDKTILRVLSISEFEDENGTAISHSVKAEAGTIIS